VDGRVKCIVDSFRNKQLTIDLDEDEEIRELFRLGNWERARWMRLNSFPEVTIRRMSDKLHLINRTLLKTNGGWKRKLFLFFV
jgi:hypothetical protein